MTRLLAAELLKLRTTWVTYVLLGVSVLVTALTAAAVASSAELTADPALALAESVTFSSFLALVAGILLTTNEYRHGTITSTFLVTPSRPHVLAAKLLAGGVAGAAFGVVVAAVAFGIAVPWLSGSEEEIAVGAQLVEAVGLLLAVYVLYALVGVAAGAIVQNQVGAIVATIGWLFVIEQIISVLSALVAGDVGEEGPVAAYLPGAALSAVASDSEGDAGLEAGWALLLSSAYVAVLAALGTASMVRRDPV